MRLVLTLLPQGNFSRQEFERKYRSAMHGIIHSCLSSSVFPVAQEVHDSGEPGLFAFSGLSGKFGPDGSILSGQSYKLTISSPVGQLFFSIATHFKRMFLLKKTLSLGDSIFSIANIGNFNPSLKFGDAIVSDGPIVLTASSEKGKKYVLMKGNDNNLNNTIDTTLFSKLFKANLKHKAEQLKLNIANRIDEIPEPSCVEIQKKGKIISSFTVRMQMKPEMSDYFTVGNRIKMLIPFKDERDLADFGKLMDCGFGVMNSYGFGFMKKVLKHD